MSLANWLTNLRKLRNSGPQFNANVARVLGSTAIEEVSNRIIETGQDAKGSPLRHAKSGQQYSPAELPISTFVDAGMITPEKASTLPIMVSYVDVKKAVGRYRGKRDMMLTGRMWGNTGLTELRGDANTFYARVEGRNAETQAKLDRNAELSEVDLLALSQREEANLAKDYDTELQLHVDRFLQ